LPVALLLQLVFTVGLVLVVAPLGVLLPDIAYGINVLLTFLMFLSPIGFHVEQLPVAARPLVWLNPVYYMLETFRSFLIAGYGPNWPAITLFIAMAAFSVAMGAAIFRRLRPIVVDID
jgi:lipopolysaccharide transport system permease protein